MLHELEYKRAGIVKSQEIQWNKMSWVCNEDTKMSLQVLNVKQNSRRMMRVVWFNLFIITID